MLDCVIDVAEAVVFGPQETPHGCNCESSHMTCNGLSSQLDTTVWHSRPVFPSTMARAGSIVVVWLAQDKLLTHMCLCHQAV